MALSCLPLKRPSLDMSELHDSNISCASCKLQAIMIILQALRVAATAAAAMTLVEASVLQMYSRTLLLAQHQQHSGLCQEAPARLCLD